MNEIGWADLRWWGALRIRWHKLKHDLCGRFGGHDWCEDDSGYRECQSWCGWYSFPADMTSEERMDAFREWVGGQ